MKGAAHLTYMGEMRKACKILVRNSEGERPLGRLGRRWEDSIRILETR